MKTEFLQIRVEPELNELIKDAVHRTGLSRSEVLRQSLRKGIPLLVQGLEGPPRRTLADALMRLKGLEIPERRHRAKRSA